MAKHISLCCPDLTVGDSSRSWVTLGATLGADGRGRETGHLRMLAEDLLKEAGRREHEAREEVIKITFRCLGSFLALGVYDILDSLSVFHRRSGERDPATGELLRHSCSEVAGGWNFIFGIWRASNAANEC